MSDREDWRDLRFTPHPPDTRPRRKVFSCVPHGWNSIGVPCPQCKTDAADVCANHGWSATGIPCPKCQKGEL